MVDYQFIFQPCPIYNPTSRVPESTENRHFSILLHWYFHFDVTTVKIYLHLIHTFIIYTYLHIYNFLTYLVISFRTFLLKSIPTQNLQFWIYLNQVILNPTSGYFLALLPPSFTFYHFSLSFSNLIPLMQTIYIYLLKYNIFKIQFYMFTQSTYICLCHNKNVNKLQKQGQVRSYLLSL